MIGVENKRFEVILINICDPYKKIMKYSKIVYQTTELNCSRFLLGEIGKRNILFIGVNPNTASDKKFDLTTKKVKNFSSKNGFSGWFLANLYPLRSLTPDELPTKPDLNLVLKNMLCITEAINDYNIYTICCCWGNSIDKRDYLRSSSDKILNNNKHLSIKRLGTLTRHGNPRHPSRIAYETPLLPLK